MQIIYAKSVQGESHKKREEMPENKETGRLFPCEDRSFSEQLTSVDGIKFSFLCVCDGHGGAPYFRSGRGAELAIEVLKDVLIRNMKNIYSLINQKEFEKVRNNLAHAVVNHWKSRIDQELRENPIKQEELLLLEQEDSQAAQYYRKGEDLYSIFGCTMVACFVTDKFWYALQIGDGALAVSYSGKDFFLPVPEDPECFLNQTTSLCDSNAEDEFRYAFGLKLPECFFCMSDGVENSFGSSEEMGKKFCVNVAALPGKIYSLQQPADSKSLVNMFKKEIDDYLPVLSSKGSGDDVSVAMIINTKGGFLWQ